MTIDLQMAAKTAYQYARDQRAEGSIPIFLGLNGMLALMHRDIQEYTNEPEVDKLLSLAAHAVCALAVVMEEDDEEEDGYEDEQLDEDDLKDDEESTEEEALLDHPNAALLLADEDGTVLIDEAEPVDGSQTQMPESTMIEDAGRWSAKED